MDGREIKNARITKTTLGYEDHGILTAYLQLDYGGSGQAFGGYSFDAPIKDEAGKFLYRQPAAFGMEFVAKILEVVDVRSWEALVGKHIRADASHSQVFKIGNLLKDVWFDPEEIIQKVKV